MSLKCRKINQIKFKQKRYHLAPGGEVVSKMDAIFINQNLLVSYPSYLFSNFVQYSRLSICILFIFYMNIHIRTTDINITVSINGMILDYSVFRIFIHLTTAVFINEFFENAIHYIHIAISNNSV